MSAPAPSPSGRRALRVTIRIVVPVVFALSLYHLFTDVIRFGYVVSRSMEPTLKPGEYYIVSLHAYRDGTRPRRGDIIVFTGPDGLPYVKRVVGLPGDRLYLVGGMVWVNGGRLTEPYLKEQPGLGPPLALKVPADRVFVLGDNRNFSEDSRDYGPVPLDQIMGRVTRIIWPLRHARTPAPPGYDQ